MNKLLAIAALTAAGLWMSKQMKKKSGSASSATGSVEVNVPVSTAYNQWTQFEEFPEFMSGVTEVRQIDDTHLHWCASVAGKDEEWDAEITRQVPDSVIAWRSTSGARNEGTVSFRSLSGERTRIELRIDYEPQDTVETIGSALGALDLQVNESLRRFKSFIEGRGSETGAWRGTVGDGAARPATT